MNLKWLNQVYRNGDKVFKVYDDVIKDAFGEPTKNPILKHPKLTILKLKRLMALNSGIKHTDLVEDLLYVDGSFKGIVLPYYDGQTFLDLKKISLLERVKLIVYLTRSLAFSKASNFLSL